MNKGDSITKQQPNIRNTFSRHAFRIGKDTAEDHERMSGHTYTCTQGKACTPKTVAHFINNVHSKGMLQIVHAKSVRHPYGGA